MIIDGQKWSCETCIKGHRASTCEHFDRQLVLIKKKGRPSTQCLNCRELRAVRQLHRRCDCLITKNNEPVIKRNDLMIKENMHGNIKGRKRHKLLRPLAPKQHVNNNHVEMDYYHHQEQGFSIDYCGTILHHQMLAPLFTDKKDMQPLSLPQTDPTRPTDKKASCCNQTIRKEPSTDPKDPSEDGCQKQASPGNACCSSKARVSCCSTAPEDDPPTNNCCSGSQTDSSTGSLRPPLSCLGPAAKNQQGEIIRLVTCRCGDDCACVGCDAHPSRAMKEGKKDVYIGFNEHRRLSISAAIPFQKEESIPSEDGMASLCGCGCSKRFDECSNCLLRLCSEYDV